MHAALVQLKEAYQDVNWIPTVGLSAVGAALLYTSARVWNSVKPLLALSSPGAWSLWFGAGLLLTLTLRPLTHWCFQLPTAEHDRYAEGLALSTALPAVLPLAPVSPLWATGLYITAVATTLLLVARRLLTPRGENGRTRIQTSTLLFQILRQFMHRSYDREYTFEWEGIEYHIRLSTRPDAIRFFNKTDPIPWTFVRRLETELKTPFVQINGQHQLTLATFSQMLAEQEVFTQSSAYVDSHFIICSRKAGGPVEIWTNPPPAFIEALRARNPTLPFRINSLDYPPFREGSDDGSPLPPAPPEPRRPPQRTGSLPSMPTREP